MARNVQGSLKNKQNGSHEELPKLCNKCLLHVADETLGLLDVIGVLGRADPGFCQHLDDTVLTQNARQRIKNAGDGSAALGEMRQALTNSIEPRKVDKILQVMNSKLVGATQHAEEIQRYYHEKIRDHRRCEECDKV